ncbi:MAG TPA: short-chain dehydrogenase, partial [Ruminococcaceae bacterium]|nr:short-chain dehydrogenase [Oscillospiraceae bacterium]
MKIAIVTGASSGLGREFVRRLCAAEKLDEIWAVARRGNRLRQMAERFPGRIRPLPLDLTDPKSLRALENRLKEKNPEVRFLVNAAGFGKMGKYA